MFWSMKVEVHYCEHETTCMIFSQQLSPSRICADQGPEFVSAAAVLCDADLQAQQALCMFV